MSSTHFNAKEIEEKWQKYWEDNEIYKVNNVHPEKENKYILSEFSYPSGNLHVGHWYSFALPDMYARYMRMKGYNVLYPTGFDAFGLPAENAAIKLGKDPKEWTWSHMELMRKQLKSMGASFDWSREIVTASPSYFKWTQWMFNTFFKNDLVYRDITKVNWCQKDKTILANEQVVHGNCERCGSVVVQKDMPQWMIRISNFADSLVSDLDNLDWNEAIKQSQREWIGKKEGYTVSFDINHGNEMVGNAPAFTTRIDTIYGVSYLVCAPEHNLVQTLLPYLENGSEVLSYIQEVQKKSDLDRQQTKEKTGVVLQGVHAVHPLTKESIQLWIADYVLAHFGTGIVMAVPAHDERDYEFAQKYSLEIIPVIDSSQNLPYTEMGNLINSGEYTGSSSSEAMLRIAQKLQLAKTTTYRLKDWGISRQRYWGCPIPIVYDPEGKAHAIPDEYLPWELPTDVDHTPDGTAPLSRSLELKERTERIFGKGWVPEVDTMDAFVDSSWYFYRYLDPQNDIQFASKEAMKAWTPVDTYFGGAEHTTMHLLYSRFWTKALHFLGLVHESEPYVNRYNRGLILGPDGSKMSKSKGNVVDPDEIVSYVGADTVRCYLAFIGPFNEPGNYPWDPNGVVGIKRFLERSYRLKDKITTESSSTLNSELHKLIYKVGTDIPRLKYNTAISALMVFVNLAEKEDISQQDYLIFVQLLAPFAPHLAEELWFSLGKVDSVHLSLWPSYDEAMLTDDVVNMAIQVNGKVRTILSVPSDISEETLREMVMSNPDIQKWISGKVIQKFIYIPGRITNIVV